MRFVALAALLIIATLTREATGVLLWLLIFAHAPRNWRQWLPLGIIFTVAFLGLRLMIDTPHTRFSIGYVFGLNVDSYRTPENVWYQILFWCFVAGLWQRKPDGYWWLVLIPFLILTVPDRDWET